MEIRMLVGYDIVDNIAKELAVLAVTLLATHMLGILLDSPNSPKKHIRLLDLIHLGCERLALHKLVEST